ncbi:RNA 2'-phosphotransferase [Flexithrix dorotheae]|uniref:RNA 2'-phosphotransferase n=1 Tax=Flexithrix dorotheae TaxID=70993 RepID=UPI00035E03E2|nr:RNA 2'-phosphotransferase [Flexithrix dorotheae]
MSLVLRHRPELIDIKPDENGWVDVPEFIGKVKTKIPEFNTELMNVVVDQNNKKRFAYNEDLTKIRASQGHSIKVDLGYQPAIPPEFLFHGTVEKYLDNIKSEGIRKMNRHHVHLSKDRETAITVGERRGKPVILKIKAKEMLENGAEFFVSENGVWLTEIVLPGYILFPK